jgi:hypothetical protein
MTLHHLAISFEEDGTAMFFFRNDPNAIDQAKAARAWLIDRRIDEDEVVGRQVIFEYSGDLLSMDYDSYGEPHLTTTDGEAELIYDEDSTTINLDKYSLGD